MRKLSLISALILGFGVAGCSDDDDVDCVDRDGDGYGVGADCLGADCDDTDPDVWATITAYPDDDGDGVYSDTSVLLCEPEIPTGYSATAGDDCDDNDPDAWEWVEAYEDLDLDGYGAGALLEVCIGSDLPEGFSYDGSDCDDEDETVWETVEGYADLDGDQIYGSTLWEACTDGTLPTGWQDTPGTDCDDFDPFSYDDTQHIGCDYPGVCMDTEMGAGLPDMRGIGACQSVDCDGVMPTVWDPTPEDTQEPCANDAACDDTFDKFCLDNTCWAPPLDCQYDVAGLTCSELAQGCLSDCGDAYAASAGTAADFAAYAECLQFDCFESATPKAQYLYSVAQDCAAIAGCFAAEDMMTCVQANCMTEFVPCLGDAP